jgi:hypothetical protein
VKKKRTTPPWTPFERGEAELTPLEIVEKQEVWVNSRYIVYTRRIPSDDKSTFLMHLSIKRVDRDVIRDWRDLQRIKNELCGPEWEGVELFPAESRLVDTANQYHLWCFPFHLPFGFLSGRLVSEAHYDKSRQRPWEDDDARPRDLLSQERVDQMVSDYLNKRGKNSGPR